MEQLQTVKHCCHEGQAVNQLEYVVLTNSCRVELFSV